MQGDTRPPWMVPAQYNEEPPIPPPSEWDDEEPIDYTAHPDRAAVFGDFPDDEPEGEEGGGE